MADITSSWFWVFVAHLLFWIYATITAWMVCVLLGMIGFPLPRSFADFANRWDPTWTFACLVLSIAIGLTYRTTRIERGTPVNSILRWAPPISIFSLIALCTVPPLMLALTIATVVGVWGAAYASGYTSAILVAWSAFLEARADRPSLVFRFGWYPATNDLVADSDDVIIVPDDPTALDEVERKVIASKLSEKLCAVVRSMSTEEREDREAELRRGLSVLLSPEWRVPHAAELEREREVDLLRPMWTQPFWTRFEDERL